VPQGVDTSIYGTLGQGQQNPLAMISQFAGAQNALNQNALFQQTFRARQAMGPLMQQATDPQSGQVDWDKAATLVATHPDTSFLAPEFLNNIAQKKLLDAETTNQKLEATGKRMDMMAGIYSAAAKDPNVNSMADMGSYMSQAMSIGAIDPSKYKETIAFLADPKYANLKGPDFRNQVLLPHAIAMQRGSSALTALTSNYDPNAIINADGSTSGAWMNPARATATPAALSGTAGAMSAGPTAGAAAVNAAPSGPAPSVPGGDPFAPGPSAPNAGPSNPLIPGQPAPGPNTLTPNASAPAAPRLGAAGPMQQQIYKDTGEYKQDIDARESQAQALLLQMQQAQRLMKNFTPNGAASIRAELGRLASGMGLSKDLQDQLANGSIDDTQAAQKLFFGIGSQMASQLIKAGGGRMTQTEWNKTLETGSPNIDMTPGAISKIMTAMREMAHVTDMERDHFYGRMQQQRLGVYDMGNVRNDWAKTLNGYLDAREGQQQ
jgi:hypothetical protein